MAENVRNRFVRKIWTCLHYCREACAVPRGVYTLHHRGLNCICIWTCLHYRGMCCAGRCLHHRDQSRIWTCIHYRSLCCSWSCLHHKGLHMLLLEVSTPQGHEVAYVSVYTTEACAAPGVVYIIRDCAAPGRFYTTEACAVLTPPVSTV